MCSTPNGPLREAGGGSRRKRTFSQARDPRAIAASRAGARHHVTWIVRRGEDERVFGNEVNTKLPRGQARRPDAHNWSPRDGSDLKQVSESNESMPASRASLVSPEGRTSGPSTKSSRRPIGPSSVSCVRCASTSLVGGEQPALAPFIDPNVQLRAVRCPHGALPNSPIPSTGSRRRRQELRPSPNLLLATGYEQVRSVVAELAGDHDAATRMELVLPASGSSCGLKSEPEPRYPNQSRRRVLVAAQVRPWPEHAWSESMHSHAPRTRRRR